MAMKTKVKPKVTKKTPTRSLTASKSIRLKTKPARAVVRKPVKRTHSVSMRRTAKVAKVESRRTPVESTGSPRPPAAERTPSKGFANAVHAYENGIKLIHAEEFERAKKCLEALIASHPEEPEIQERAKVLIQACDKKLQEKARTVLRTADDHYNVGIADLNRRAIDSAIQHLQHALKLAPKADHVLYALAVASALEGNRDQALGFLKQSIHYRPENRFLAIRDSDFDTLLEDEHFKGLVTGAEK
jgi:tetratricopeptide (TPR) repeat protein